MKELILPKAIIAKNVLSVTFDTLIVGLNLKNQFVMVIVHWCIQAIREASISICVTKLWCTKTFFQVFFFQLYFTKKYLEVAINDFIMHLITLKWLRIQKCRQKKKNNQSGRSERRNCQQKCFHLFNYIIDRVSTCFFIYVNSVHCFEWFFLY